MPDPGTAPMRWLLSEWAVHLATAIEGMGAEHGEVRLTGDATPSQEPVLCWRQDLQLAGGLPVWVGGGEAVCSEFGRQMLHSAGVDDPAPEDAASTVFELFGQGLSGLARSISSRLGAEVVCGAGEQAQPPAESPHQGFAVLLNGQELGPLWIILHPGISQVLENRLAPSPKTQPPAGHTPAEQSDGGTMGLLLEVELPVSVSFGRAHLPLKDVIKLTTGSIVELNRSLTEPVEVIVNNCVIARGEVVVIDGNYGVRIHEIVSRQERLRTLS